MSAPSVGGVRERRQQQRHVGVRPSGVDGDGDHDLGVEPPLPGGGEVGPGVAGPRHGYEEENEKGVVTLSSLHSSKGLQWGQVWIAASNQGVCPSQNALDEESTGGIPEERRLFYVGMTRAVDELYMSFNYNPKGKGTSKSKPPSQFLCEGFPDEMTAVLEDLNTQAENAELEQEDM